MWWLDSNRGNNVASNATNDSGEALVGAIAAPDRVAVALNGEYDPETTRKLLLIKSFEAAKAEILTKYTGDPEAISRINRITYLMYSGIPATMIRLDSDAQWAHYQIRGLEPISIPDGEDFVDREDAIDWTSQQVVGTTRARHKRLRYRHRQNWWATESSVFNVTLPDGRVLSYLWVHAAALGKHGRFLPFDTDNIALLNALGHNQSLAADILHTLLNQQPLGMCSGHPDKIVITWFGTHSVQFCRSKDWYKYGRLVVFADRAELTWLGAGVGSYARLAYPLLEKK